MSEVVIIAQLLLKYGPDVAAFWRKVFVTGTLPTDAEWDTLLALIDKSGESYFKPAPESGP